MELHPGTAVTPNLRLVRLLGRGAMGSVWVAHHLALNTHVAIKFMSANVADDPVSVRRFTREAKAAAQIRNPHVVQIFDHGITDDGMPFIVMELLEGEGLDKRVRRLGPISLAELVEIATQVCKALAKAHEIGIVHRDIKPANIFLTDSGGGDAFVKVLDFGVAKFSGEQAIDMTSPGHMVGTPSYMSPEQYFDAKHVSYRSDLWSLGVVAYTTLTGQRPFSGATLGELCVAIKAAEFVPPSQIRGDLPLAFDAWQARALARDPADRFASAKHMAEELERVMGLATVMGSSPSLVATGAHQLRTYSGTSSGGSMVRSGELGDDDATERRPVWVIALALAASVVAGGALAGVLLIRPGGESAPEAAAGSGEAAATSDPTETSAASSASAEAPEPIDLDVGEGGGAAVEPPPSAAAAAGTATPGRPATPKGSVRPGGKPAEPSGKEDERSERAGDALGI